MHLPRLAPWARVLPPLPGLWKALFGLLALMGVCLSARAEPLTPVKPTPGSVQVMFLPPPLEEGAVYSVGVYDATTGRLVRRLHEDAEDGAFSAGLNGFITFWDRKDDAGKTVPAGRYAARGWAVGEMKVEGEAILGNDWAEEDESLRVTDVEAICPTPRDGGFCAVMLMASGTRELARFTGREGRLTWRKPLVLRRELPGPAPGAWRIAADESSITVRSSCLEEERVGYRLEDGGRLTVPTDAADPFADWMMRRGNVPGPRPVAPGRNGTIWSVDGDGLYQSLPNGTPLRQLSRPLFRVHGDLTLSGSDDAFLSPVTVAASPTTDQIYYVEEATHTEGSIRRRVRGLEWSDTKPDAAGHPVSEWKTFFERGIRRPDPALGLDEHAPSPVVEFPLARNPLDPGKPQRAKLRAGFDAHGSFLETADGLRLLPVSTRPLLCAARLSRDPKDGNRLLFYQFDGAAWDVFSITGVPKALVGFDAGEFELTADGERHPLPPPEEPRDP